MLKADRCIKCGSILTQLVNFRRGFVCLHEECERYGLISLVSTEDKQEGLVITRKSKLDDLPQP